MRLMAMGTVPCLLWKWWTWWVVLRLEETRAPSAAPNSSSSSSSSSGSRGGGGGGGRGPAREGGRRGLRRSRKGDLRDYSGIRLSPLFTPKSLSRKQGSRGAAQAWIPQVSGLGDYNSCTATALRVLFSTKYSLC